MSLAFAASAAFAADTGRRFFDVPAGDATETLKAFAAQARREIVFPADAVTGIRTNTVKGRYTPRNALNRLVAETELAVAEDRETGAFVVRRHPSAAHPDPPKTPEHPSQNMNRKQTFLLARWLGALAAAPAAALAQATPPASGTPVAGETVELSPFVVTTDRDTGYFAENTLAGSRLNTRLRDTPGSISVFTPEFITDLAITDLSELIDYTVNSEMDVSIQRSGFNQNEIINTQSLTRPVLIRGLDSSQGMDFFTSITPVDPYRVGRYEDSRGPNSILFGIGAPGGLLNQSSKLARTDRNSATLRYGMGSWSRSRAEIDANRVLIKDKLALTVAGVHQENEGWRNFDYNDKDLLFASVTYRPIPRLTLRAMGEVGDESRAVLTSYTAVEEMLAWYDNREVLGVDAVTFTPTNANPSAALLALGVTARDGNRTGNNRRITFIENDGVAFDAIGTYLTGTYNNAAVRAPDGTPGRSGGPIRINDRSLYPYHAYAGGPGMARDQRFNNYTFTADWQITDNLTLNVGHNFQETKAVVNLMVGQSPIFRGDANRTLGIGGPANPNAGRLYFDGNWQRDIHDGHYKESRVTLSYRLETKSKWLGTHRFAALLADSEQYSHRYVGWMVLGGRPFNNNPINANNRVNVRHYVTEGDFGTYRTADWRTVPSTLTVGGQTHDVVYANADIGPQNGGAVTDTDSQLGVIQSRFLNDRLVTTLGLRQDKARIAQFGYRDDPILGAVVDTDPEKRTVSRFTGRTDTIGAVFHLTDWVSLVANRSSSVGIPDFSRTILPHGGLAGPPEGEGRDYGLAFDLLGGRLNAKVVYFTSFERGRTEALGAPANFQNRNRRIMDAFATALVGPGLPLSASAWDPVYSQYTPPIGGSTSDVDSDGYEARITGNLKPNWRFVVNYSYTDSGRQNLFEEALPWYGFKQADGGRIQGGVTQNAAGQYVVDPNAFEAGGTVARWIELGALHPAADLSTLATGTGGVTVAQEIRDLTDFVNQSKEDQEKRWGLRPHKISLFTAYDFQEGWRKGFSVGGGWRWRSANVIGSNSRGDEITGRAITSTDLMLRYSLRPKSLPGRLAFQVNVTNVFDKTGVIPQRLSSSTSEPDSFEVPGGRGLAYSRFDLVNPREIRFTTTYSF
jgi:iron complex outermembrane recepter protein